MKSTTHLFAVILLMSTVLFAGCKQSLVISKVDYSQSIESVLTPDENGLVKDVQRGLTFNIKPLQYAETQDTSSVTTDEVRYIRGSKGYYYITASGYQNVYVMAPQKGKMKLKKKLNISENGLQQPALNQRNSYVQLLNRSSGESWKLYPEQVQKEESKIAQQEGQ